MRADCTLSELIRLPSKEREHVHVTMIDFASFVVLVTTWLKELLITFR